MCTKFSEAVAKSCSVKSCSEKFRKKLPENIALKKGNGIILVTLLEFYTSYHILHGTLLDIMNILMNKCKEYTMV